MPRSGVAGPKSVHIFILSGCGKQTGRGVAAIHVSRETQESPSPRKNGNLSTASALDHRPWSQEESIPHVGGAWQVI